MGVYIKGMEMPKGRPVCIVIDAAGQALRYDLNNDRYADDKLFEAVPVPPHGRLIDADALRVKQQEDADLFQGPTAYCDKCRRDEAMNAVANIVNAPTVIEAEEGE